MGNAHCIFLVDDDPVVLASLSALLQTLGAEIQTFLTAEDFLNGVHEDSRGCVVTDLKLAGISGLQLQEHLNKVAAFSQSLLSVGERMWEPQ